MAELTPLYMDISGVYSGDELGLPYRDIMGEGVVGANDLLVTQHAGSANLSVDVAAGAAWVLGDTDTNAQPCYRVRNDAVVNKGITPDPSNPRKVTIVAQVTDATFSGAARAWAITAIHGTPAASPVEPALPASAFKLAVITVPAGATSIVTANIADARVRAVVGAGQASGPVTKYVKTTPKQVVNTTTATDLLNGEITIPALSATSLVRITARGDWFNASGAAVVPPRFQLILGGTVLLDTSAASAVMSSNGSHWGWKIDATIQNLGATNSQWSHLHLDGTLANGVGAAVASFATGEGNWGAILLAGGIGTLYADGGGASAVDTSVANLLQLRVLLGTAGAFVDAVLKSLAVEVL